MNTGIKVGDAMTLKPVGVAPEMHVAACAQLMKQYKVGSLVVSDGDKLIGILTENDMVRRCLAEGKNPLTMSAMDLCTENVVTVNPEEDIFDAIQIMIDYDIRHLPVTIEEKLVGFITVKDILKLEPALFDILSEKFELRESERKLGL